MKKIIQYLGLNKVGFLELLFAVTPILIGYGFNGLPLSLIMYIILIVVAAFRRNALPMQLKKFFNWLTSFLKRKVAMGLLEILLTI